MSSVASGAGAEREKIAVVVIHGVGETEPSWINDYIIDPIARAQPQLEPDAHSEVHQLPDDGRLHEVGTFPVVVRRATTPAADVMFAELRWSDLSKVGNGPITFIGDSIKLMFEAPDVLAQGFMRGRWLGLHAVIALLVLLSSRILKRFIVGLNVVVIICTLFMSGIWALKFQIVDQSPMKGMLRIEYGDATAVLWLTPVLLVLIYASLRIFWANRQDDIGLSEFGLSIASSSALILFYAAAISAIATGLVPVPDLGWREVDVFLARKWPALSDFDKARTVVFGVWVIWCVCTLASIALLIVVFAAQRLRLSRKPFGLQATWAAIFNVLVQAIILKLVITPASILACSQLHATYKGGGSTEILCTQNQSAGVFFLALIELIVIAIGLAYILKQRAAVAGGSKPGDMPRLIVHPLFIALAVVSVVGHITVFTEQMINLPRDPGSYISLLGQPTGVYGYDRLPSLAAGLLVLLSPVYIAALWLIYALSAPIVLIARQLVDHQYWSRARAKDRIDERYRRAVGFVNYPRRGRIAGRLSSVIDNLVAKERADRIVFLAHSQGTVITFDYLRSPEVSESLGGIGRIDVVTMGSPLSHIYAHYFVEYAAPVPAGALRGRVASWVNFWRIDDPIGDRVDVVEGLIDNRRLGPGGHVNYWKEPEVRCEICRLLGLDPPPADAGPGFR